MRVGAASIFDIELQALASHAASWQAAAPRRRMVAFMDVLPQHFGCRHGGQFDGAPIPGCVVLRSSSGVVEGEYCDDECQPRMAQPSVRSYGKCVAFATTAVRGCVCAVVWRA